MEGGSRKISDRITTLSTSSNYWIIAFRFVLHMKPWCRHGLSISTVLHVVAQSFRVNLDFPEKLCTLSEREREMKEGKGGVTPDGPKMAPSASNPASQSCALAGKIGLSPARARHACKKVFVIHAVFELSLGSRLILMFLGSSHSYSQSWRCRNAQYPQTVVACLGNFHILQRHRALRLLPLCGPL